MSMTWTKTSEQFVDGLLFLDMRKKWSMCVFLNSISLAQKIEFSSVLLIQSESSDEVLVVICSSNRSDECEFTWTEATDWREWIKCFSIVYNGFRVSQNYFLSPSTERGLGLDVGGSVRSFVSAVVNVAIFFTHSFAFATATLVPAIDNILMSFSASPIASTFSMDIHLCTRSSPRAYSCFRDYLPIDRMLYNELFSNRMFAF